MNNVIITNKVSPFSIFWNNVTIKYYNGILYKITNNPHENTRATYETFNSRFNIN